MAEKKRSKRLYVYWAVALTLLLAAGLFSWLVVVPVVEVNAVLDELTIVTYMDGDHLIPREASDSHENPVERLGGPRRAAQKLSLYLRMPGRGASQREKAVLLLGACGEPAAPALARALTDADERVRRSAASELCWLGTKASSVVPALTRALGHPDPDTRFGAAGALGAIGPQAGSAVPALTNALADVDSNVRASAASALGSIGPQAREAVPALAKLLNDPELSIREDAAEALGKIGPDAAVAVPALVAALKGRADWRRNPTPMSVARALGRIGPAARAAIPALEETLQEEVVGDFAREALKKIRDDEKKRDADK